MCNNCLEVKMFFPISNVLFSYKCKECYYETNLILNKESWDYNYTNDGNRNVNDRNINVNMNINRKKKNKSLSHSDFLIIDTNKLILF